jgi:hypothetical protein
MTRWLKFYNTQIHAMDMSHNPIIHDSRGLTWPDVGTVHSMRQRNGKHQVGESGAIVCDMLSRDHL